MLIGEQIGGVKTRDMVKYRSSKPTEEKRKMFEFMEYSRVLNQNLRDNFEFEDNLKPLIVSGILLV